MPSASVNAPFTALQLYWAVLVDWAISQFNSCVGALMGFSFIFNATYCTIELSSLARNSILNFESSSTGN